MEGAQSTTRRPLGYQPGLDGIRALAITGVVLDHIWHHPVGGDLGVDLFYVLSGFLITTLLLEERGRHGRIRLGLFYLRRALRLLPALWAMLAVTITASAFIGGLHASDINGAIGGLTYTTDFLVGAGSVDLTGYNHLWSLAVEEQFYLVFPVLLILMARWLTVRQMAVTVFVGALLLAAGRDEFLSGNWVSSMRFDSILIGCAAALAVVATSRVRTIAGLPVVLGAAVAVMTAIGLHPAMFVERVGGAWTTLIFALAAAVLVLCAVDGTGGPLVARGRQLLTLPVMVFLGRISYAVYLWHVALRGLVFSSSLPATIGEQPAKLTIVGLTLVAATCSYYLVEKRFLRLKWRLARTPTHDRGLELDAPEIAQGQRTRPLPTTSSPGPRGA